VGVILEFPKMYELIDRTGIALEIPDKLLVLPALLERRKADLLIEFHRLCHLANMQRVGSQFIERHRWFSCHQCIKRQFGLTPVSWRDESLDQALWLYVMLSSGFVAFFGSAPGGAILPSRPAH